MTELTLRSRASLTLQRRVGHLLAPLWLPAAAFLLRFCLGYRIRDVRALRRRYRKEVEATEGGTLLCANHLTMIDSALVAWALGGSFWYVARYAHFPWNLPERRNFASNFLARSAAWVVKCIPVVRGGDRDDVADVLARVRHLLSRGETVLVFPEGGRSRSGRVEPESVSYGVGRILTAVPECRTLCVYLRGEGQETWSTLPKRGEAFHVDFEPFHPDSPHEGLRRARDLSRQIARKLAAMEERYFSDRAGRPDPAPGARRPETGRRA